MTALWRVLAPAAVGVALLLCGIGLLAAGVPTAEPADTGAQTTVVGNGTGVDRLHATGVTGRNVTVGVVDATGFDTDGGVLDTRVTAARAFGTGSVEGGPDTHGTAVATVLARTAPGAELALARVDGVRSYRRAIRWLRDRGVDVIVAPVAFYGQPGDGSGPVATAARRAVADGVVVVTPAGNVAQSHWAGRYDTATVADGTVEFTDGTDRAFVRGGTDLVLWLSWDRDHADEDYTAELYWTNGTATRLVARSQPYRADDVPNERIVADVPPGRYFLRLRGPDRPTGARLRLVSPTHDIQYADASGSVVAPATARGVISVGAYNERVDRLEPFSSRGPTVDGRTGVDLVASDRRFAAATSEGFVGSSAATAYAGGVAALVEATDPTRPPREVGLVLTLTARDAGRAGVDSATGYGVLQPVAAVRAARNATGNRTAGG